MSAEDKATLLLRDVPGDVARELDARAETNYRSRSGEAIAILTAVCRGHVPLPVSMDGATIAAIRQDDVAVDDGLLQPFEPESLEKPGNIDDVPGVESQEPAGGDAT